MTLTPEDLVVPFDAARPDRLRSVFEQHGVTILRGVLPTEIISECRDALRLLTRRRLESLGHRWTESADLDATFDQLCAINRSHGGEIYGVAPDLPVYQSIVAHPNLTATVSELMAVELLQLPFYIGNLRIDRPREEAFLFDWHQEYTFNMLALDAITAIIPLTDITEEMGAVACVPGSHREIAKVRINAPDFASGGGRGGYIFSIARDREELEREAVVAPLRVGDALLVHCLTLHRSGKNLSTRNRWSINPRYSDFFDQALVRRGWVKGVRPGKILFGEVHADKVVNGQG
jgi:ectoine hydroxylase-related dioxygenase (phytanoyl-CoA dioxygenase family)